MLGAGVVGSVYAGKLELRGHEVTLLARGHRYSQLRAEGVVLEEATSGERVVLPMHAVSEVSNERYDLALVTVRFEQLNSTFGLLRTAIANGSDVLFFGNVAGRPAELASDLGSRVLFGFPAVGGVRAGSVVRYVTISQQKTMLGELNGETTPRVLRLKKMFDDAGFSVRICADVDAWMLAHASFILPIVFSLYRCGTDAAALAADPGAVRLMVRATRQGFAALRSRGNAEVPTNLRVLYSLPGPAVVAYWRRVFASPRGEQWFAAHARASPVEMRCLAMQLQTALTRGGGDTPELDWLLSTAL